MTYRWIVRRRHGFCSPSLDGQRVALVGVHDSALRPDYHVLDVTTMDGRTEMIYSDELYRI